MKAEKGLPGGARLASSALLIVDMNRSHLDHAIGHLLVAKDDADRIIATARRVREAWSRAGLPVIFVRTHHRYDPVRQEVVDNKNPFWQAQHGAAIPGLGRPRKTLAIEGSPVTEVVPPLAPRPGEFTVFKHRYSPFHNTDLELLLKNLGAETLVVGGVNTNNCILCTCFEAFNRDLRVLLVEDMCASMNGRDYHEAGVKLIEAALPALDLGEDPLERGLVHGRALAAHIAANLETYLARFEASGLARDTALAEGARWLRAIAADNDEYAAEIRGIAEGAGQSEAAIALLNARYEIAFTLFGKDARAQDENAAPRAVGEASGCTIFGALPEATADGGTWLGQNWDWLAGVHGRNVVLRIQRRAKPSLLCLTEAGIVGGKMGLNEHGIGLVENGLASDGDGKNAYRKPFHVRCREVLDADRFDQALMPIVATSRVCSANFVVGHADGEILDLETSPDRVTVLHPRDGLLTHSNHFIDPCHGVSQMERIGPNTLFRAARLERLLRQDLGRLEARHFRAAFADHFSRPNSICRHPDERQPAAKRTMTCASVLLDLKRRVMHVANGPPCEHAYVEFALDRPLAAVA